MAATVQLPTKGELMLPEVPLADLLEGSAAAAQAAHEALTSLGAVSVAGVQHQRSPLGRHVQASLETWASCLLPGGSARDGAVLRPLPGGVLRVSKVAGGAWDEPPSELSMCPDAASDTEAMRKGVRSAARALVAALDVHGRNRSSRAASVLRHTADGTHAAASLAEVVELGEHLEHLHVYQEGDEEEEAAGTGSAAALEMHTDAGFLLAFVPPVSGTPGDPAAASAALQVTLPSGEVRPLAPPGTDSVLFFIGESAKMLLKGGASATERLRPVPHALLLERGFGWRAWYGAMVLLPQDAVLRPDLYGAFGARGAGRQDVATFGRWWEAAQSEALRGRQGYAHVGCGRALEAVDQTGGCGAGKIACWHACVPVDESLQTCTGGQWISKGLGDLAEFVSYSVQCREPSTGFAWPEETADHCESCVPQCTLSADVKTRSSLAIVGDFCIRTPTGEGTTMYMDGFKWTSASTEDTCLAFLFPTWVVDRWWKLILALMGVVAISTTVELVGLARRRLPPRRQHDVGLLLHVLSLTVAYVAMLFVMTYSLEMLLCVLLGLTTGHVLSKRWSPAGGEKGSEEGEGAGTPCCKLAQGISSSTPKAGPSSSSDHKVSHIPAVVATDNGPAQDIETIGGGDMTTVQLKVTGMTCSSCTKTVSNALAQVLCRWPPAPEPTQVEGVFTVNVDLQEQLSSVVCRTPPTRVETLSAAVRDVGFEVAGVTSSGGGASSTTVKDGSARHRL